MVGDLPLASTSERTRNHDIGSLTQSTDFTRDVLGRYVRNTLDEALLSADPNNQGSTNIIT